MVLYMIETSKSAILVVGLLMSAALLTGITSITKSAKTQTTVGGHLATALKIINDQIVAGGQNIVKQTTRGGIGVLKQVASFFGVHDLEDHINATSHDIAKGNTTGASSELKMVNKGLLNDSSLLAERIGQITQNSSAYIEFMNEEYRMVIAAVLVASMVMAITSIYNKVLADRPL